MDVQEPMATSAAVAGAGCTESGPGNSGSIPSTRDSETPKSRQAIAGAPSSNDCTEVQIEAATTAEMKLSLYGPTGLLLPRRSILSYGTGHMLNDLTAACWFTYLLIFLTDVGLSPQQAATVMLSGQVADGIATIFVGQLIDKFGHFKIWHAGGSILVALSFSSVFGGCYACELLGTTSFSAITIGYSTFAAIFNLGWAATQVSHMSLVNCITANATSRVSLNSCRNAFSMVANLCLYAIAYVVFWMFPGTSAEGVHKQFRWIAWISIFTGSCFVIVFLFGVKEPRLYHHHSPAKSTFAKTTVSTWFKKILYYQVAVVYTLTRLTTNVSQALLSFYLIDDLMMGESSKAVIPALIYICSFLTSIVLQELHWTGHRLKGVYAGGACLWIFSGAALYLLPIDFKSSIYGLAGIIGLGNALMLVTATSMQGVLVGHDLSGVAFVYGSLSFLDKLTCGIALYLIEGLNDETRSCRRNGSDLTISCSGSTIRTALGLVPSACALVAALVTVSMNLTDTDADTSVLSKPLLDESATGQDQGETSALRLNGHSSEAEGRSKARSILPFRGRRGRNYELVSGSDETDEGDIEKNKREEDQGFSIWKLLEMSMVGRWGSIRRPMTWLE
ncbi:major facilitator superfamily domain-containing protein 12 [Marchantia polymorpha subsp. ruderalis]